MASRYGPCGDQPLRVYNISKYEYLDTTKKAVFWIRVCVIDTKQTGNFEREIKLEYGQKRKVYVNTYIYGESGLKASAKFIGTDSSPIGYDFPEWIPIGYPFLYNINEVMEESIHCPQDHHDRDINGLLKGVVTRFNMQKGFGFITCDDGSGDVFVDKSEIKGKWSPGVQMYKTLREGEKVEFKVFIQNDGRRKAINVTGPDGAFVIGYQGGDYWGRCKSRNRGGYDNYGGGYGNHNGAVHADLYQGGGGYGRGRYVNYGGLGHGGCGNQGIYGNNNYENQCGGYNQFGVNGNQGGGVFNQGTYYNQSYGYY